MVHKLQFYNVRHHESPKKVPTDLKAGRSKVIQLLRFLTTVLLCSHWSQRVRGNYTKNVCFLTRKCLQHLPMSVVRKSFRSLKGALKIIQFSRVSASVEPTLTSLTVLTWQPTCLHLHCRSTSEFAHIEILKFSKQGGGQHFLKIIWFNLITLLCTGSRTGYGSPGRRDVLRNSWSLLNPHFIPSTLIL